MILGYSRTFGGSGLPSTGMTMHFDFSDISTLYKTFTVSNDPDYSSVATADGDTIQVARSIFPVATSDWTAPYTNSDSSRSPIYRAGGMNNGKDCIDFDGSNDRLFIAGRTGSGKTFDNILTTTAYTILIAFRPDVLPANPNDQQALWGDAGGNAFSTFNVINLSGTTRFRAYNHDGNYDSVDVTSDALTATTTYVGMVRHESGTLYASINGGSEFSVASGTTSSLAGVGMYLGDAEGVAYFNGRIGEIVTWNVALTGSDLTNAITYFTSKWL